MRARYLSDSTRYVDQFPLVPLLRSQWLDADAFSHTKDHLSSLLLLKAVHDKFLSLYLS
jgi:hypothetical protein